MLKTTKGLSLGSKIYQKVDGEWKIVATLGELIESYNALKMLKKENKTLKKDKNLLSEEIKNLKKELFGKNQTIKNFQEKQEKRYGQLNERNRYEGQKDYHKR